MTPAILEQVENLRRAAERALRLETLDRQSQRMDMWQHQLDEIERLKLMMGRE